MKSIPCLTAVVIAAATVAGSAAPSPSSSWASSEIARVTDVGVLGHSAAAFRPQALLTERALAAAIATTDKLLHPPQPPPPPPTPPPPPAPPAPAPVLVLSTIPDGATIGGTVAWQVEVTGADIDHVAFALDGKQLDVEYHAPFALAGGLATASLPDGPHQLATAATRPDGGTYVAVWTVTTANASGATPTTLPSAPVSVPVTKAPPAPVVATATPPPTPAPAPAPAEPPRTLYTAVTPSRTVTVKELDAALVRYLGLGDAATKFQRGLRAAGLAPPLGAGTEIVARLLALRLNHPASQDDLELLPFQPVTRAEAAYSFAHVLSLGGDSTDWVKSLADTFSLPAFDPWQQRILRTAVSYVGYPYVWGGTSPTTEAPFGSRAPGGFDCSGFVWRVYKLTSYPDEGPLASVLRGRTTFTMSAEVPRSKLVPAARVEPGDTLFFGVGRRSSPSQVDHMGIYLGNGWIIHSSDEGVTLVPFDGRYLRSFAWARRPLHEAGLI